MVVRPDLGDDRRVLVLAGQRDRDIARQQLLQAEHDDGDDEQRREQHQAAVYDVAAHGGCAILSEDAPSRRVWPMSRSRRLVRVGVSRPAGLAPGTCTRYPYNRAHNITTNWGEAHDEETRPLRPGH